MASGTPVISYAQRFEDVFLAHCFGTGRQGFYIDIGSGHPVYDNTSFAFYLQGWRGITVEPNPWLARLTRAVRPRDHHVQAVVGAGVGESIFHLVEDFHGLSTTIESHAQSARSRFGKDSERIVVPMTTLSELCDRHDPPRIDFLKVDVEGAEQQVLLNANWQKHRPKVVLAEALAPYTLAPAWQEWEPFLRQHGYRYAWFDSLNRYYIAEEAVELAHAFDVPPRTETVIQFRNTKPALTDEAHPDHHMATLFAATDLIKLPLLGRDALYQALTADIPSATLETPAQGSEIAQAIRHVFGADAPLAPQHLRLSAVPPLREVYAAIIETDEFCAACGRISASYAW